MSHTAKQTIFKCIGNALRDALITASEVDYDFVSMII